MTFDPFGELDRLANGLTQLRTGPRAVPVDLVKEGDSYILNADLPGVDPGSIDIDLDGNLLTIRAERTPAPHEGAQWLVQERRAGSYMRQFTLGEGLDTERISASYDHGVLSLMIPVSERSKPRKIALSTKDDHTSISA
ncbi:Hsp20/alpha crystallin family protein [Aeromicrobium wangtongii]|uniref:Hsp20/alpha crystallin family protein n=1 Tax=Aeromicrobium wangtongii TaxID=2969247 RepID=A0ABY5M7J4_9ACTN|nr:Hsp20/alpha crystallin family protein [Aeromicrobium wangtongii]MCD9199788.1 Hsp20/alpha crystallin family protein [Aeromicrobium wangtongii]MCL3817540.1 Hsp20/alpha crystallin family protein [Aeromicrobium wangtongii]UUP14138.1 Hsp20/alpha crystallin family protein [Aeromicrobium wangtongii]